MKFSMMTICLFLSTFTFQLGAQETIKDNISGELFPKTVSFDHNGKQYHLEATGATTRKKLIIKVYSLAHYLQKKEGRNAGDRFQSILRDDVAKQFTMRWLHNVDVDKIQEAYQDGFRKNLSPDVYNRLQNEIDQFISFFNQPAKKGDEYILRWIPGGMVEVHMNGKKAGSVTNPDLARGLWSIWVGDKSIVNRDQLVSLM